MPKDVDPEELAYFSNAGESVRTLGKKYGISKTVAHVRVQKEVPEDLRSKYTPLRSLREDYLVRNILKLSPEELQELEAFFLLNQPRLLSGQMLSTRQEKDTTRRETSGMDDWRGDVNPAPVPSEDAPILSAPMAMLSIVTQLKVILVVLEALATQKKSSGKRKRQS